MKKTSPKDKWRSTFSFEELEKFLRYCKRIAPVVPMRDYKTNKGRCIILRQDADLDLYPSYEFAKMQIKLNIRSTFFILTTSHTYNPQSAPLRRILKEMADDGFEIGLHFDPTVYGNVSQVRLEKEVKAECKLLENITGSPITSIALHNPSIMGKYPFFKGLLNANKKELFSDEQYISDSMRVDPTIHPFRGKEPYTFIKQVKKYPIHIALHPEQFFDNGGDYLDTIMRYSSNMNSMVMRDYQKTLEIIRRKKLWCIK
jgi:hypothetical protein